MKGNESHIDTESESCSEKDEDFQKGLNSFFKFFNFSSSGGKFANEKITLKKYTYQFHLRRGVQLYDLLLKA